MKVSQLSMQGQTPGIEAVLNEKDLSTERLISILNCQVRRAEAAPSPLKQKLVENCSKLIKQLALLDSHRVARVARFTAEIASVMEDAEINYSKAAQLNLAEAFQVICKDQEAVDLIM